MRRSWHSRWAIALSLFALSVVALAPTGCGDGNALSPPSSDTDSGSVPDFEAGTTPTDDGGTTGADATPGLDAAPPTFSDGTPVRMQCGGTLGHGLSPAHGRLDGQLVSIVGPTDRGCPSDPDHLHLQVKMNSAIYDIAVNLDGLEGETDAALPGIPFAEGWHEMNLDYARDLNLHSTALTLTTPAAIRARVLLALTNANHISVFGTGYPGSDGAHLIHRKVTSMDGALIINPLAAKAHVIAFRFATDTF